MKIVHVETGRHFYGGAQQVIWLLSGLRSAGIDCQLVCPPDSAISVAASREDIPVTNLSCAGDHDLRFAWRLRKQLCSDPPDIVHCHSRRGADFLGGWAAKSAGVPAVLSRRVDNPEPAWISDLRYRPYYKVIAISENIAAVLTKSGFDWSRLVVIRDAVDVDCIEIEPDDGVLEREFDIAPSAFSIAVVAQLIPRKGHRFILDVLPGLCTVHPFIKVVFFGTGDNDANLRALSRKLGLSATVRFAGFRHDLDEYLAAFDVLVHPAEREGLGVAMLKGAAAGLPVVAFDIAGATEAVAHGKTGVLIPPGDMAGLQNAIELMIEEPQLRADLGDAGRQRMRDDFSVETMVESHIELYEQILRE
jgi:glycosyltransferase involved in cell wall biosynthesis